MNVDWREMFIKYINVVVYHEGVTFLHESEWTPEEWAAVGVAKNEADRRWAIANGRQTEEEGA